MTIPSDLTQQYMAHACACSPFAQRLIAADALLAEDCAQSLHLPYRRQDMEDFLARQNLQDEVTLKKALRLLRQRVMLRTIVRDLNHFADLHEVMRAMTDLAEVAVQCALSVLHPMLVSRYGEPLGESGQPQQMIVVGMGKLGGEDLNVSSDIDLIFAYEEDGETSVQSAEQKSISHHDFFIRLGKLLIAAIDEVTADGFVFRVDMRLRPYGSEGPLACSLAMLEDYYQNQGREWERYAWIKGRVIAGPQKAIHDVLKPFVYRKYLDFGVFASMRDLKRQIERDVNQRDMRDNIKLGRGGIREIEFIAQVFQLIRGGQDVSLQIRPTLQVLQRLAEKQLLPAEIVTQLIAAYHFLRQLEHRIQYQEDQQTQDLPSSESAQQALALAMDMPNWESLLSQLEQHRVLVDGQFKAVFANHDQADTPAQEQVAPVNLWQLQTQDDSALQRLSALGYQDVQQVARRLLAMREGSRYRSLPEISRQRLDKLMPMVIDFAAQQPQADQTLMRVQDLLESICRRASYLALLAEFPAALQLLTRLVAASPWLAQYLAQHPVLLDELLDTQHLYAVPDFSAMRHELQQRMQEADGDIERQMDLMRQFKHAAIFRFAAKDVAGDLPLTTLSDYLSDLANLILQVTIDTLWPTFKAHHRERPLFAIIGYGKLGGKELAYASDLDIIFLYDDEHPNAGEIYARFGQRINTWLNSMTAAGLLYETDMQLRPDGASGLLVSSVQAFDEYQMHKAWTWEHQALTRAAFSAGDSDIGQRFEQIRQKVMQLPREPKALRMEVLQMRQKMREAHTASRGMVDIKQSRGGIIDVEFIVQYLVLLHAQHHPELTENIGNIALLRRLADLHIIPAQLAEEAAQAYLELRKHQHAMKLQGLGKLELPTQQVQSQVQAVQALWQAVME